MTSGVLLADRFGSTMGRPRRSVSSGNSQKSYTYDIYGEVTGGSGALSQEFDFAGQQTDATGLQYLRARYYDPETGAFLSRDPLAAASGWRDSHLGYAASSPATLVDPTGLYWGESKVNKAKDIGTSAVKETWSAVQGPHIALTALYIADIAPIAEGCAVAGGIVGASSGGVVGAIVGAYGAYRACDVVEDWIGLAAAVAYEGQILRSKCSDARKAAATAANYANVKADFGALPSELTEIPLYIAGSKALQCSSEGQARSDQRDLGESSGL